MVLTVTLSIQAARDVMLAAQRLDKPPGKPATKADVLHAIRLMCHLQIDTINVVARSPYLVLWSRLESYQREWLDELLAEGALFEYWAHAMCFIPTEDYALYRRRIFDAIEDNATIVRWALKWSQGHAEVLDGMRAHLRERGSVRSADFEDARGTAGGWWNWKEEKDALEAMFYTGEVMIARRHNFQRVYTLREHLLPDWDDTAIPSSAEFNRTVALRAVKALGIARPSWVPDYFRQLKTGMFKRLEELAADGSLCRVQIEGLDGPAYVHPDNVALVDAAESGGLRSSVTTLLSPFDPVVWDRNRALELFGFDYKIECYTPSAKRRFGYFTLPILHRGRLVGRLDPKAHRARGVFEIRAIHLEPGVQVDEALAVDLASALPRLADWHGTPELVVARSDPPELKAALDAAISAAGKSLSHRGTGGPGMARSEAGGVPRGHMPADATTPGPRPAGPNAKGVFGRLPKAGTLIVVCGLPCAGKTTMARCLEAERPALRLSPDEWIDELLPPDWDRKELDRLRDPVEKVQWNLAQRALRLGIDVVLEWGSWGLSERDVLRAGAREIGAGFELLFLDVKLDVLLERLELRDASPTPGTFGISADELRQCWSQLQRPTAEELADVWPPAAA